MILIASVHIRDLTYRVLMVLAKALGGHCLLSSNGHIIIAGMFDSLEMRCAQCWKCRWRILMFSLLVMSCA